MHFFLDTLRVNIVSAESLKFLLLSVCDCDLYLGKLQLEKLQQQLPLQINMMNMLTDLYTLLTLIPQSQQKSSAFLIC